MGKDGWKLVAAALERRQQQGKQEVPASQQQVSTTIRIRVDEPATR